MILIIIAIGSVKSENCLLKELGLAIKGQIPHKLTNKRLKSLCVCLDSLKHVDIYHSHIRMTTDIFYGENQEKSNYLS